MKLRNSLLDVLEERLDYLRSIIKTGNIHIAVSSYVKQTSMVLVVAGELSDSDELKFVDYLTSMISVDKTIRVIFKSRSFYEVATILCYIVRDSNNLDISVDERYMTFTLHAQKFKSSLFGFNKSMIDQYINILESRKNMRTFKEWSRVSVPLNDDIISHGSSLYRPLNDDIISEVHSGFSIDHYHDADFDEMLRLHSVHDIPDSETINHYTIESKHIKEAVKNRHDGIPIHPDFKPIIRNLDAAIDHRTSKEPLTLYSGLKISPIAQHGEWHPSMTHRSLYLHNYTSTSTKFSVADGFAKHDAQTFHHESEHHGIVLPNAKHILRFNIPAGFSGIGSVMRQSHNRGEFEFLMSRDQKFNVAARPHEINKGVVRYIWDATPIEMQPYHHDRFL